MVESGGRKMNLSHLYYEILHGVAYEESTFLQSIRSMASF
ncbi:hypothetical protein PTIM40_223 [Cyanophage P-TIM40]|uniref:Uncharacterized protein n=1 Tax=Cyanophage P-TIM40 TaxID=1589733 RepID=A0A0C5AED9_9CAUD|nr:hypothetical protein AU107_gp218 [Cyanophage P-TIM40]AJK27629.1 hypothetical protein PTIM40_223 [Cyanophage P-TIM40]